ncbi:UPF0728 protein C10orf53 homolog [Sphaeramia orbicularis]|uniref:UPF0728 protein C10orf53 homolog n=1 Tax=Sphaeramia orbicularis TaxID=375764 RepID=UPI00117F0725|nr:UPF0728 protein C10orf53 homolog [Sphaeramia orbicularis]
MPKNAQVTVKYGPYESSGTVQHRTFRLQGLLAALNARGHRCVLEESHERDQVDLLVNGQVVYTCDIRTLEFGGDGKLDPVCEEAVLAVDNAY